MLPYSYQEYVKAIKGLAPQLAKSSLRYVILYGNNLFLKEKLLHFLQDQLTPKQAITLIDWKESGTEELRLLLTQRDLFCQRKYYRIVGLPVRSLLDLAAIPLAKNVVCLLELTEHNTMALEKWSEAIQGALLVADSWVAVPCVAPEGADATLFVQQLAKRLGLTLEAGLANFLSQHLIQDLHALENLLRSLACLDASVVLDSAVLESFSCELKKEHIFDLSNFLLDNKPVQALLLLHSILEKEDNPLGCLGLLARHCRICLQIAVKREDPTAKISLKLPYQVLIRYNTYVQKLGGEHILRVLLQCQKADVWFKSTKQLQKIDVLADLVYLLCSGTLHR